MTELVYYRLHRNFEIAAPDSTRLIDRSQVPLLFPIFALYYMSSPPI